jgi:hypothetical protein
MKKSLLSTILAGTLALSGCGIGTYGRVGNVHSGLYLGVHDGIHAEIQGGVIRESDKIEIGKHIMDKSTYFKTFNELSKINNKKPSHQDLIEFSNQFDCNMDNYLSEKEANKGFKYLNSKNNSLKKD